MADRPDAAVARSFARFAAVGIGATPIHVAVFALLVEAPRLDPVAATVAAFAVAFVAGYLMNRRWTFRSSGAWTASCPATSARNSRGSRSTRRSWRSPCTARALALRRARASLLLVPPVSYALARFWAFRTPDVPTR